MNNTDNTTTKIPAWKYVLPAVTFSIGFGYGKIVKKCWGCAFGYGFLGLGIGIIPLGIHYNKIHTIGMKAVNEKETAQPEPKEKDAAQPVEVKTSSVVDSIEQLAKSQNKEAAFNEKKEKITKAIDSLNNTEKSVLTEMMALGKNMSDKKVNAADTYTAVMSKMAQLQKKYGAKFIADFSKKMKDIEAKFEISLNSK